MSLWKAQNIIFKNCESLFQLHASHSVSAGADALGNQSLRSEIRHIAGLPRNPSSSGAQSVPLPPPSLATASGAHGPDPASSQDPAPADCD